MDASDPSLPDTAPASGGAGSTLAIEGLKNIREIGRGGMGVVFQAEKISTGRIVAVKVMSSQSTNRQRFQQEIRTQAKLRDPGIVQVFDAGLTEDGRDYFEMEYVKGGDLSRRLNRQPIGARAAASLVAQCSRTMHSVHEAGKAHRDLKPSNVFLDGDLDEAVEKCRPKIGDFGLAKEFRTDGQLTPSDGAVGTWNYMAPEQARGNLAGKLDRSVDVYSLGAILYECLTGRPPYDAGSTVAVLEQVFSPDIDPKPLHEHNPSIPWQLEVICLKCLEFKPKNRYPTAEELANDLERFLTGEPIEARPPGPFRRTLRSALRHRWLVLAAVAVVLVATAVAATSYSRVMQRERDTEKYLRERAELARDKASQEQERAEVLQGVAESARDDEKHQRELAQQAKAEADRQRGIAESLRGQVERVSYFSDIRHTQMVGEAGNFGYMRQKLRELAGGRSGQPDLPGFEYHFLCRQCRLIDFVDGSTYEQSGVEFNPDGKRVAWVAQDGTLRVWDISNGKVRHLPKGHDRIFHAGLAWDRGGTRLATASVDKAVQIWDVALGKEIKVLMGHEDNVESVSWNPDGNRLVSASLDGTLRIWDTDTGDELRKIKGKAKWIHSTSWSPDGKKIASAADNIVQIWNADSGEQDTMIESHSLPINVICWSPDSKHVAGAGGQQKQPAEVQIWDAATGKDAGSLTGHTDAVFGLSWSPDGKRLASASDDKTIRIWDAATRNQILVLKGHSFGVHSVSWSPDGKRLASSSTSLDKTLRLWNVETEIESLVLRWDELPRFGMKSVSWSHDGKRLASGGDRLSVWDRVSGKDTVLSKGRGVIVSSVAWSPDDKRLASAGWDGMVRIWEPDSKKEEVLTSPHTDKVWSVAWSPDGKHLASASGDRIWIWNPATREEKEIRMRGFAGLGWSPNSTRLACASTDKHTVWIFDAQSDKNALPPLQGHDAAVYAVSWNPDGKRLATASDDRTLRIWDAESGKETLTLRGHSGFVRSVCWSPDSRRLASGSSDGTIRIWDGDTATEILTLKGHKESVDGVSWSPDGHRLASASYDGTVRIWNGEPMP